jgi:hypothetical protein
MSRPVASTIAMRCMPPPDFAKMRNCTAKMPMRISGPRMVPIRNAFDPTACVNSRFTIGAILDIRRLLERVARADGLDENLF